MDFEYDVEHLTLKLVICDCRRKITLSLILTIILVTKASYILRVPKRRMFLEGWFIQLSQCRAAKFADHVDDDVGMMAFTIDFDQAATLERGHFLVSGRRCNSGGKEQQGKDYSRLHGVVWVFELSKSHGLVHKQKNECRRYSQINEMLR